MFVFLGRAGNLKSTLSFYTVRDSCKVERYKCNENNIVALRNLDSKKAEFFSPKTLHNWLATSTLRAKFGFIKKLV